MESGSCIDEEEESRREEDDEVGHSCGPSEQTAQ
jgi:hypothetical protein